MHSSWKSRGSLGFLAIFFWGGTWGCQKIEGPLFHVLLHLGTNFVGPYPLPPAPPPSPCASMCKKPPFEKSFKKLVFKNAIKHEKSVPPFVFWIPKVWGLTYFANNSRKAPNPFQAIQLTPNLLKSNKLTNFEQTSIKQLTNIQLPAIKVTN
jgi:hypothetical protein